MKKIILFLITISLSITCFSFTKDELENMSGTMSADEWREIYQNLSQDEMVLMEILREEWWEAYKKDPADWIAPDASHTLVTSFYEIRSDGMYDYTIRVENPPENTARLQDMIVDISCDKKESYSLGQQSIQTYSTGGTHPPIEFSNDKKYSAIGGPTITRGDEVIFIIAKNPGDDVREVYLLSNKPAAYRDYQIDIDLKDRMYDWGSHAAFPKQEDYGIKGQILMPRCDDDTSEIPPASNDGSGGNDNGGGNGGGNDDSDDDNPDDDNTDCEAKGQGNANGLDNGKGKGHENSNGKHLGHCD